MLPPTTESPAASFDGGNLVDGGRPPPAAVVPARRDVRRLVRRGLVVLAQLSLLAVILLIWEHGSGDPDKSGTLIDEYFVSRPSAIWNQLGRWRADDVLFDNVLFTLQEAGVGFAVGAVLGMACGFVLAVNRLLGDIFRPFVGALYSIPRLALVPLFILWFGLGMASKVALVASVVFFLVFYNTYSGVRDVDPQLVETMRLMRASRWQLHTKATLPSATTWIIAGLHVSAPYALVVAVVAEMMASNRGMGYLIVRASGQFNTAGVFAGIAVLMVMGIALGGLVSLLERRLLRWKPQQHR